ncbi:hypothetical protein BDN70DRAFT_938645 [Pholiota conissans]|uniref:Uncharacterized protein n=1 Tax=Pholiota conissans TaxID=109636 RepID=A0A9P5YQH0_9AGAR|nr:hypothetical protein BDN70DRAFT_938645 [Pholiota conissans]
MKDHDANPKDSGVSDPYHSLLSKLTGREVTRPRCKTGVNTWRKTHRDEIEMELRKRMGGDLTGKRDKLAAERDKIAREMFSKLSQEEQKRWKAMALEEHEALMKEYKKDLATAPSCAPEDRQRCIQGLVQFMQPILDMVTDCTGWSTTFMAGGPEPAQHGQLNIMSIHSGTTGGEMKMNFGHAERERFKKYIVPIFGHFLQQCYGPEECRSRALSSEGYIPLSAFDFDKEGATVFSYDSSVPLPPISDTACSATVSNLRGRSSEPSVAGVIKPIPVAPNVDSSSLNNIRVIRSSSSSNSAPQTVTPIEKSPSESASPPPAFSSFTTPHSTGLPASSQPPSAVCLLTSQPLSPIHSPAALQPLSPDRSPAQSRPPSPMPLQAPLSTARLTRPLTLENATRREQLGLEPVPILAPCNVYSPTAVTNLNSLIEAPSSVPAALAHTSTSTLLVVSSTASECANRRATRRKSGAPNSELEISKRAGTKRRLNSSTLIERPVNAQRAKRRKTSNYDTHGTTP